MTAARAFRIARTLFPTALAIGAWIWIAHYHATAQGDGGGGALAPMRLPFQGRLLTPAGDPVPEGTATVLFSLYEAATGGTSVWSSGSVTLGVKKGGFVSALLGDAAHPLSGVDFRNAVYLGVKIDRPGDAVLLANEPEMLPRIPVVPPLYAHLAGQADQAGNSNLLAGYDWRVLLVNGDSDPAASRIRVDKVDVLPRLTGGGSADGLHTHSAPLGATPSTAALSAQEILASGDSYGDGTYWIDPDGAGGAEPYKTYADMSYEGGGWTMVYNSVTGTDTMRFWRIRYADRLGRKGIPGLATNFYDGSVYQWGREYVDFIEDLEGTVVMVFHATATEFDPVTMRFLGPNLISGNVSAYLHHFAGGWASFDFDGDMHTGNCATEYCNVSQHYNVCWVYSLGCGNFIEDGRVGPHASKEVLDAINPLLWAEGNIARVRRITRFAR